jgi:1-acyl-sn-glycerol-3-phosphate acyltransferase
MASHKTRKVLCRRWCLLLLLLFNTRLTVTTREKSDRVANIHTKLKKAALRHPALLLLRKMRPWWAAC